MPANKHERETAVLRELAREVMLRAGHPKYAERARLWNEHNSLRHTRPPVLVGCGRYDAYEYELVEYECAEPVHRELEFQLRHKLFKDWLDDDSIMLPCARIRAVVRDEGWGVTSYNLPSESGRAGAYKLAAEPALIPPEPLENRMRKPGHAVDERATRIKLEKAEEALGGIMPVSIDRRTKYYGFGADISYAMGQLLGIERLMLAMCDYPEWLRGLSAFIRDGILSVQDRAERAGDFTSLSQHNQAEPLADETLPPWPESPASREQIWGFFAAQEFAGVSPAMHEEFLFQYQLPVMEKFGLVAYGCCEDLTGKIQMLKQLKNLRRIAVTPWADVESCARQIGDGYVISWRPSPAAMVSSGFNKKLVSKELERGLKACSGCHVDILLKDIQTVEGEAGRLRDWVLLARDIALKN